jgi:O-Antigen ligase
VGRHRRTGPGSVLDRTLPYPGPNALPAPRFPSGEPGRVVLAVVACCIALTPLVVPKGPGRGTPVDLLIGLSCCAAFVWAWRTRAVLRLPYVVPTVALLVAGLIAALVSTAPRLGALAVVQEIFLFLWCAVIATVCRTPRALRVVMRTWALSATAWAALLVTAVVTGQEAVSGVGTTAAREIATSTELAGGRARLLFDHPNMAGIYFMAAIFVVVAAGCPRRWWLRVAAVGVLLTALVMTGSNAALGCLAGGAVVALFLHIRARRGLASAAAVLGVLVALLGVAAVEIAPPLIAAAQQSENSFLRYSIGRSSRSADARQTLFVQQFELYARSNLLGVGPSNTRDALRAETASTVKQAHNDYLATLVERGPLGVLALLGLIGTAWVRLAVVTRRVLSPAISTAVPVPAALAGACAAFAATAVTHEILHYRWLWALLGVVAALHLLVRAEPEEEAARSWAGSPRKPGVRSARVR